MNSGLLSGPSARPVSAGLTIEEVQDLVGALILAGTAITATYNDGAGTLTIAVDNEALQDAVGSLLTDSSVIDVTYDDAGNVETFTIAAGAVTNTMLAGSIALSKLATDPLARANHTGTQPASTISDFAEALDDRVAALLTAGSGISLAYDDTAGTLTITSSGGVTDEHIMDVVGSLIVDSTDLDVTYDDASDSLSIVIKTGAVTNAMLAGSIALSKLVTDPLDRANHTGTQTASTISDFAEALDDRVAALLTAGANVSLTYDDTAGTLTVAVTSEAVQDIVGSLLADSSDLDVTYDDAGNALTIVIKTGAVTNAMLAGSIALSKLATDPLARANHTGTQAAATISDFAEAVDDRVATLLVAGTGVTVTYDDTAGTLTIVSGSRGIYGDGSDGNVTISGSTTLTRDMFYDTLTVQNGGVLNPGGFRIYCRTLCQIDTGGKIANNGNNSSGTSGGTNTTAGTIGRGSTGGAGGTAAGNAGTAALIARGIGGTGGTGGTGTSGAGAAGGAVTALNTGDGHWHAVPYSVTGMLHTRGSATLSLDGGSGGGGGGGDGTAGGGGGGGGGAVLLAAAALVLNGTIEAKGGNGGTPAGGNRGGGGGGGGGVILLTYNSKTGSGSTSVVGGTKGLKTGTGTDGADGGAGVVIEVSNV